MIRIKISFYVHKLNTFLVIRIKTQLEYESTLFIFKNI